MSKNQDEEKIKKIFCKVLAIDKLEFSEDLTYNSFAKWDSLKHLKLVSEFEQEFDIEIDMDDVIAMENFKKVKKTVNKYLSKKGKK